MMIGPNVLSTASCNSNNGLDVVKKSTVQRGKRKLNGGISLTPSSMKSGKKSRLYLPVINGTIIENNGIHTAIDSIQQIDYNSCIAQQHELQQYEYQHINFNKEDINFQQQEEEVDDPETKELENSNLSWLLDFKVASLFDPTDDSSISSRRESSEEDPKEEREEFMASTSPARPNKPPYTYTELIEQALKEKGELTVSGIYYWISERFPFYKVHDDRWKNSVRHNLSINPHFRKGMKASQGAGHLWTLSTQGVIPSPDVWKKNRMKNIINLMDEVAVATASIEEPSEIMTDDLSPQPSLPLTESSPDPSLARSAEEILSGVKRQVEVQYLTSDSDFLSHISKDDGVEESNLVAESNTPYLISELGSEVILTDGLFCDDLNFQCCELTNATHL